MYSLKKRDSGPEVKTIAFGISFLVAFFQLAPFMDLIHMLRHGNRFIDDNKKQTILRRDLIIKLVESAPQAFFQAYVLFAIEAHGQPLRVFSLSVSIISVSLSLAMTFPELVTAEEMLGRLASSSDTDPEHAKEMFGDEEQASELESALSDSQPRKSRLGTVVGLVAAKAKERLSERRSYQRQSKHGGKDAQPNPELVGSPLHESMIGKFIFWVYLASDTFVRAGGYAVVFSAALRHVGVPLAIISFALCQLALSFWDFFVMFMEGVWWIMKKIPGFVRSIPDKIKELASGLFSFCLESCAEVGGADFAVQGSESPQDWDVACAELCLPCLPCLTKLALCAYFFIAGPIGITVVIALGTFSLHFSSLRSHLSW
ncbi:unnamed protein product [Durusdinium trenchii]|uniref:BTB domain-containing protein n=2 Tax=Durusdinium trenchii TaxID=1381693 RepID=A0ABP0LFM7_9DINO